MVMFDESLSVIVPVAVSEVSPAEPESTLNTAIVNVSDGSTIASSIVKTPTVADVFPTGIVI